MGSVVKDFYFPEFILLGSIDIEAEKKVKEFYLFPDKSTLLMVPTDLYKHICSLKTTVLYLHLINDKFIILYFFLSFSLSFTKSLLIYLFLRF